MILCDINNYYRLGAYGMDLVHNWEPERATRAKPGNHLVLYKVALIGDDTDLLVILTVQSDPENDIKISSIETRMSFRQYNVYY